MEETNGMSLMLQNEYRYNTTFKKIVDEHCKKNEITLEEAFKDEKIRKQFYMYTEV